MRLLSVHGFRGEKTPCPDEKRSFREDFDAACAAVKEPALQARVSGQDAIDAALKAPLFHGSRCFRIGAPTEYRSDCSTESQFFRSLRKALPRHESFSNCNTTGFSRPVRL
jgi:hypothetical protein